MNSTMKSGLLETGSAGLAGQFPDLCAHLPGMPFQLCFAFGVIRCLDGRQVGIQRGLGIHDDFAFARQAHHHVRTLHAAGGRHRLLRVEITMLHHAGQFGQALQGYFTPLAAHLGASQRLHQVAGFRLQQALRFGEGLMPVSEPCACLRSFS
jgi:hypothetical protein